MKRFLACHGCTFGATPVVWIFKAPNMDFAIQLALNYFKVQVRWKGTVQVFCLEEPLVKLEGNTPSLVLEGENVYQPSEGK